MAPEQAKGKPADERSDVFSFGVTLYEALAGRRAFAGDTVTEVLAAVLEREPDLARPSSRHSRPRPFPSPPLPEEEPGRPPPRHGGSQGRSRRGDERRGRLLRPDRRLPLAAASSRRGLATGLRWGWAPWHSSPSVSFPGGGSRKEADAASAGPVRRFQIDLKADGDSAVDPRLPMESTSRTSRTTGFGSATWIGSTAATCRGARKPTLPFWSPDGRNVAFVAGGFLKRAPIDGGPVRTICEMKPAGFLYLGADVESFGIDRRRSRARLRALRGLLGGRGAEAAAQAGSGEGNLRFSLAELPARWPVAASRRPSRDGPPLSYLAVFDGREVRRLLPESTPPSWTSVYSNSGYILFNSEAGNGSLYAVPFDASNLKVTGEPIRLVEDASSPRRLRRRRPRLRDRDQPALAISFS